MQMTLRKVALILLCCSRLIDGMIASKVRLNTHNAGLHLPLCDDLVLQKISKLFTPGHRLDDIVDLLHTALETGNCREVGFVLKQVKDTFPLAKLLYVAVLKGKTSVVIILLQAGVDVNQCNEYQSMPLIAAAERGFSEIVALLLAADARVDAMNWRFATALWSAAINGHTDVVSLLLEAGADLEHESQGARPLHVAASNGHLEVVRLLLARNANKEWTQKAYEGLTPLFLAAKNGWDEVAKELVNHDDVYKNRMCAGMTSLFAAVCGGHTKVVRVLLENNVDPDKPSTDGITPLMEAVARKNLELIQLLVEAGADRSRPSKDGYLLTECAGENPEILNLLQKDMGTLPDCCLSRCCWHRVDASKLKVHAEWDDEVWIYGAKPLFIAARNGHTSLVKALIDDGADPNEPYNGVTPLCAAIENGHEEVALLMIDNPQVDMNALSRGCTPLFIAIEYNRQNIALALILVEACCVSEDRIFAGLGALYCAAFFGQHFLVDKCSSYLPISEDERVRAIIIAAENGNGIAEDSDSFYVFLAGLCGTLTPEKQWELVERSSRSAQKRIVTALLSIVEDPVLEGWVAKLSAGSSSRTMMEVLSMMVLECQKRKISSIEVCQCTFSDSIGSCS